MYAHAFYILRRFDVLVGDSRTKRAFSMVTLFTVLTLMTSFTCLATATKMVFTASWTPEMMVVVFTGVAGAISTAIIAIMTAKTNNKIKEEQALRELQREADSKERKEVAKGVAATVEAARVELKKEIVDNTKMNEEALRAANGHNEKIATLTEMVPTAVAAAVVAATQRIGPQEVTVVNPITNPVNTHEG